MSDRYYNTRIRYEFFNGKEIYTVEYSPALLTWYIFNGTENSFCIHSVKYSKPPKFKDINTFTSERILDNFLSTKQP